MTRLLRTLGLATLVLAGTALGGCAPYSALCVDEMECRDGNDSDIDACVVQYETQEEIAGIYGCDDLWDRYLDCAVQEFRCNNGDNWTTEGDCSDQWSDYNDCVD
jgi:hypothetical protein